MTPADKFRTPTRFTIDKTVFAQLEVEAESLGIPLERLVENKLLAVLPSLLAEAAREYIASSMRIAADLEQSHCKEIDAPKQITTPKQIAGPTRRITEDAHH